MRFLVLLLSIIHLSFGANGKEYSDMHYKFAAVLEAGPVQSATWTQSTSLWLKVSPNMSKQQAESAVDAVAPKCHTAIGRTCCVHVYYGNMRELARTCE